tara:strand:+ start:57698 stop:58999 length:1302 start_codon:yes stop_codon:yes gene_type:complete
MTSSCQSAQEVYINDYSQIDTLLKNDITQKTEKKIITYINKTLDEKIQTVLCHKKEQELSLPIINLNSNEELLISFDDFDSDIKNYYFTIIHCNSDWQESELMKSEYISGFNEEPITDYEFSFNTIQAFTHYRFTFPSEGIKPILSGNYIFKVYEEGGKDIFYKRFMVLENRLSIKADVRRATLAEHRNTKHEIDFIIKHQNFTITDPFSDLKVHIKQNNREDNAIKNLTPIFVRNDELIYDYEDDNTFFANNEFRHFDIKSLRYHSDRVKSISFDSTYNHVYLFNDKKRSFDRYSIEPDINGQFIIKSQEGWKSSVEADYAFVHFTLPVDNISYGEIFLSGGFSDWQLDKKFRMKYNAKRKQYETSIYLKQGYYNYHYVLKDTNTKRIDVSFIEGTHYQTRNDYYIYVYYREVNEKYDRFVGFLKTSSKELF